MVTRPAVAAGFGPAQAVADAILFEGYLLYPYRRSSPKNRVRWQFGVLVPEPWARAHGLTGSGVSGAAESGWQQTECLLEAGGRAATSIRVRFLQLQRRTVEERLPGGSYRPVDRLETPAGVELSFDEAVPRELDLTAPVAGLLAGEQRATFDVPGGEDNEPLPGGRIVRRRWPLSVRVTVSACPGRPHRLRVRTENSGSVESSCATARRTWAVKLDGCIVV